MDHIQQHRDLKDVRETYLYIGKTPDAKAILTLDSQLEKAGWFLILKAAQLVGFTCILIGKMMLVEPYSQTTIDAP